MDLQEIENILKKNEASIQKFGVRELYIFGSFVRGEQTSQSDIDIFVVFKPEAKAGFLHLARLQIYLESLLKKPVDLGTKNSLHRLLKDQILKEAVRVA